MPASVLYSSHVAFLNHHFMTQCDIILSTPWPTGLILSYDIGVNLTRAIKRGEIPRWGFTLLFTVSLILHRGIIPNHPVSGGNKGHSAHEVVGSPVSSEIWARALQLLPTPNIVRHEGQLLPVGEDHLFAPPPSCRNTPQDNVFS